MSQTVLRANALPARARVGEAPRMGGPSLHAAFIENVVADIQSLATSVAVITTAVNAMTDCHLRLSAGEISVHAPDLPALRRLISAFDMEVTADAPIVDQTLDLIEEIADALEALSHYLDDSAQLGPGRAASLHASRLARIWRPLSKRMAKVLQAWEPTHEGLIPELYQQNSRVLVGLLAGAAAGFKPCLDRHYRLHVPDLPQKRRWYRRSLLKDCRVLQGAHEQSAFVRDVSAGGLGLERVTGLERGMDVTVRVDGGRQFRGTVTWCSEGKAGIRFHRRLDARDPMIAL